MSTAHYRRRLAEFVRTSTAYDLIHEDHAYMIENLCNEVDRLNYLLKKKDAELAKLKLLPNSGLNIDRAQLSRLGVPGEPTGKASGA